MGLRNDHQAAGDRGGLRTAVGHVGEVSGHGLVRGGQRREAARLAEGPAFALGMTKQLLNAELDLDFSAAIEAEAQGQAICMQTRNFREFHDAFTARRTPKFD